MITLIYVTGVITILLCCLYKIYQEKEMYLSDLIQMIVYASLSWASLIYIAIQKLSHWMCLKGHDIKIWNKKKD